MVTFFGFSTMTSTALSTLTEESALQAAQEAASGYTSSKLVSIDRLGDHEQGAYSITFRAVFRNGDKTIVQLIIVLGMSFDRFVEANFNDVRMKSLKNLVSRLDWLERLYRPRCV